MDRREGTLGPVDLEATPPPKPASARRVVAAKPKAESPDELLADARVAMGHELRRLKRSAAAPAGLNPADVKALALLTDAACKLAREERDAIKNDDLSGLGRKELVDKARAALNELEDEA